MGGGHHEAALSVLLTELNVLLTLVPRFWTIVDAGHDDQGQHHGILDGRRTVLADQETSNSRDHVFILDSFV